MSKLLWVSLFCLVTITGHSQSVILTGKMHHLRSGSLPQWDEFPVENEGTRIRFEFSSGRSDTEHCLALRQYNVNERWKVLLNDRELGELVLDEKDMVSYYRVPEGLLRPGGNIVEIAFAATLTKTGGTNDIRVGQISLIPLPLEKALRQATVEIEVREGHSPIPCRITITNTSGALHPFGIDPSPTQAVRPGFLYTASGKAHFGLPAGEYMVYASRGTEYSADSLRVSLKSGDHLEKKLNIRKEVPTPGWVSSDTHIHTLTYSRHGDATDEERVVTIAGEGLELPIITDHNVVANLQPVATRLGLDSFFTLVPGMELTTQIGHFNVFPLIPDQPVPNPNIQRWDDINAGERLGASPPHVILNHARDLHGSFRPFDDKYHIASAGQSLLGWKFPAQAMEVINSGAVQSDPMRLFYDWFGLLNRGFRVTPVGGSDSHTVSRYLIGQARTYIRCQDEDTGNISISQAMESFHQGRVMVSYGLVTELTVGEAFGPGDLATVPAKEIKVGVKVSGPSWIPVSKVSLYANGKLIRQENIGVSHRPGLKWDGVWVVQVPSHDVFLVAIAEGPGYQLPFWQLARPYQPTSVTWAPKVMGASGAIFLDADGRWSSAMEYAQNITRQAGNNPRKLIQDLKKYDEAVAIQVASLLSYKYGNAHGFILPRHLRRASNPTRSGLRTYEQESLGKPLTH